MAIVIAFKQPSEMTNSISGILSLPSSWSLSNFAEAMEVTDFWHSLGNSIMITVVTVVLSIPVSYTHLDVYKRQELESYEKLYHFLPPGGNTSAIHPESSVCKEGEKDDRG